MNLPPFLEPLRQTRLWAKLRDWRYLRSHRARRNFYREFVQPDSLVFDIGANVGHYVLLFRSLGAEVVAVEPQAALAAGLRRRFSGDDRVNVVQTALGAAPSTATLHKAPGQTEIASLRVDASERSRFAAKFDPTDLETVPVITLDELVQRHGRPDFCKIDVEGFEFEVLAGLSTPVPALSLEFNREFWPETVRCLERLETLGAYRFNYALAENDFLANRGWGTAAQLRADLSSRTDPLLWGDIYAKLG
jgi:FkbM family methyltransferase